MTYLIWRGLLIGRRAELGDRPFAAYFTYGLVLLIALQILINLGVNIDGTSHRFNPSVIELRRQLAGHDCGQPWRDQRELTRIICLEDGHETTNLHHGWRHWWAYFSRVGCG